MCEPQQQPNPVGPGTPAMADIPTQAPEPTAPPKSFRDRMIEGLREHQAQHERSAAEVRKALALFEAHPEILDGIEQLAKMGIVVGRNPCGL